MRPKPLLSHLTRVGCTTSESMSDAGLPGVVRQLPGDLISYVRHRPAKLPPRAFLRSRPDHIAIGIHQSNRSRRLVPPLLAMARLVVSDARPHARMGRNPATHIAAGGTPRTSRRMQADRIAGRVFFSEYLVVRRPTKCRVRPVLVVSDH